MLLVLVWDMGANNPDTSTKRGSFNKDEREHGVFKLTYDSSDEDDDDFFDSEQQTRRARRALEQDIDEKLQFWIDCIQSSAPGSAILPIVSYDDYLSDEEATVRCQIMKERLRKHEEKKVKGMKCHPKSHRLCQRECYSAGYSACHRPGKFTTPCRQPRQCPTLTQRCRE